MNLILTSIRIDGGTQARVELNQDTVAEYADIVRDGTDMPAVVVFCDGTDNWLADGFHRFFGYKQAGRNAVPCDVRTGTQRDAIIYSWSANGTHGLPRTNADKRRVVVAALADAEFSTKSDREIAKLCAVSHNFVSTIRTPKPKPEPKKPPKAEPITGGASAPAGPVSSDDTAAPKKVSSDDTPAKTEAEIQAEIAHGDDDTLELLIATQKELEEANALIKAAEADDQKAETIKWRRLCEVSQRRQQEMQARVNEREAELTRLTNWLRRCAKAVGEDDPSKVPSVVEALARKVKAVA